MIGISLPYIFNLASELEPLANLHADMPYLEALGTIYSAQQLIEGLYTNSVFSDTLRSSRPYADKLLKPLHEAILVENIDRNLTRAEVFTITHAYSQFKIALLAELEIVTAYFVSQKGGYNTVSLLENANQLFPPDLGLKVPEALFDIAEAAKCLAFERPTACGFHLFRATESVLRRYYSEVTGGKAEPKVRSIGVYLNALKQCEKGDSKILAALKPMADLHRNPLIHPDAVLSLDEALSIHGIARSVIGTMLTLLPEVPLTTSTFARQSISSI